MGRKSRAKRQRATGRPAEAQPKASRFRRLTDHWTVKAAFGVVLAAVVAWIGNWYWEYRNDKEETRTAVRLVDSELQTVAKDLGALMELRKVPSRSKTSRPYFLPSTEWQANNDILGKHLSQELWDKTDRLYDAIENERQALRFSRPGEQLPITKRDGYSSWCYEIAEIRASWPEAKSYAPITCSWVHIERLPGEEPETDEADDE